ncbi:MAG: hypothetical protein M3O02_02115 [Acidobacteriota bacterium]|nr:hypothetical protein [Acidobacteriota bacterium]
MTHVDCARFLNIAAPPRALVLLATTVFPIAGRAQTPEIQNPAGIEMKIDTADKDPALSVTVPDGPPGDRTFKILLPEHVTVRAHGQTEVEHLYIYNRDPESKAPKWKKVGNALEYETDFGQIHFLAQATLVSDGILFHYDFANSGTIDYDMATAITDPRFHAVFYDPRLERTYVHHKDGFALVAAHTPERLAMPLTAWFPVRYLAAYTIPIPNDLVRKPGDGITYRYSPDRVDAPLIATLSNDGTWVAASFSRDPGNVWTNPQLTCQHVDPQVSLPHGAHAQYEVKILIFKGTLQDAMRKMSAQINELK